MGPFVIAWLIGESIIVWRWVKAGAPPTPGVLLLPSGMFAGLAVLAQYAPARITATAFAYAVDLAVLVNVVGKSPGQKTGWPPPMITDPNVLLPGSSSTGTTQPGNPANSALPPAGTPTPGGGAAAPPNPGVPPTGPGTVYPPGSQNL